MYKLRGKGVQTMKKVVSVTSNLIATSVAALLSASLIMSGTWAWQSFDQDVQNKYSGAGFYGAGGRIHINFNGNSDVHEIFVENYKYTKDEVDDSEYLTDLSEYVDILGEEIYVRIRLEEYLEIGPDAGIKDDRNGLDVEVLGNGRNGSEPKILNTDTWDIVTMDKYARVYGIPEARNYVEIVLGEDKDDLGNAIYMPTFNMNDDSEEGVINGTLAGLDGVERDLIGAYDDYVEYTLDESEHDPDKKILNYSDGDEHYSGVNDPLYGAVVTNPAVHYAESTLTTKEVIPMDTWIKRYNSYLADLEKYEDAKEKGDDDLEAPGIPENVRGSFWVFDTDGWVYWAQPLEPRTATGVLVKNTISYQRDIGEWYYELSARAQYATRGDWGDDGGGVDIFGGPIRDTTGFFDEGVTSEAQTLLRTISSL